MAAPLALYLVSWSTPEGIGMRRLAVSSKRKRKWNLEEKVRAKRVRDGALYSTGTMPKREIFKWACGLPQYPRDQCSGQMSGITESKFIFPQWRERREKKKSFAHMKQKPFHGSTGPAHACKRTITLETVLRRAGEAATVVAFD